MKKILLLYAGVFLLITTMFGQELPKLKVTEREMNVSSVFRRAGDNETVVEVQSNVLLSFESSMDKAVNVYESYSENGFYYYKLLFPTVHNNRPITGRKLKIKSYGFDTYIQPLELKAKTPVGLLVINETQSIADNFFNQGRYAEALKEYEKVFSINPKDSYINLRIELCHKEIDKNRVVQKNNDIINRQNSTIQQVPNRQENVLPNNKSPRSKTFSTQDFTLIGKAVMQNVHNQNCIGNLTVSNGFKFTYDSPGANTVTISCLYNSDRNRSGKLTVNYRTYPVNLPATNGSSWKTIVFSGVKLIQGKNIIKFYGDEYQTKGTLYISAITVEYEKGR
ncbi:MAG: tetratricopeptide repeat protein [Prevotellaceae bacterium]|jgi:tetratricopeptide (TPR) repeat protein|nr:tetratricopeptide repeat protein [Prevotellaceae bacterium]